MIESDSDVNMACYFTGVFSQVFWTESVVHTHPQHQAPQGGFCMSVDSQDDDLGCNNKQTLNWLQSIWIILQ